MGNAIRFSVLIPVYNVEKYIDECIRSVLNQTYKNFEIVLVDDGSTDDSGRICDKYALEFPMIRAYHKSNKGLIHTRRFAIEKATGDYYIMLDSDDLIVGNALEILEKTISRNQCDCVLFNRNRLVSNSIIQPLFHIPEGFVTDKRVALRRTLIEMPYNAIVLKCAKSTMYRGIDYSDYYHIQRGEDLLQSIDLLKKCKTFEFIDDPIYIYRMRIGSITKNTIKLDEIDFTVRKRVLEFIINEDVFTADDYNDYRDKCINIFIDQVVNIGRSSASTKNKKDVYRKIRCDEYYSEFISKGISSKESIARVKRIIYNMFKKEKDDPIIFLSSVFERFVRKSE